LASEEWRDGDPEFMAVAGWVPFFLLKNNVGTGASLFNEKQPAARYSGRWLDGDRGALGRR
jgi:hypothetical protein